jgi:DDE superfamily endonuclease
MITDALDFIKSYIDLLNESLKGVGGSLTKLQKAWLAFCLTAMIFTNSINWKAWERWSGGRYSDSALSKMLRKALIPWDLLLLASTKLIISRYGVKEGVLVIDDSDHQRSKNTTHIAHVHRIKDKKYDGFFNGQNLIFLLLVTDKITLPVGFTFYEPDPELHEWKNLDQELKKRKVDKKERPKQPVKNKKYPSKLEIALDLLTGFFQNHPSLQIKCILADAFYGSADFVKTASEMDGGVQVISQIRSNQLIRNKRGLLVEVGQHFATENRTHRKISIRGEKEEIIVLCAQKLWVAAHKEKRMVIAIRYENQNDFRYIIASDMTWQYIDVIQAYTLRWLIEVFFQDWKTYEAWSNLAKQQGVEGSSRCVILSLLLDHSFFLHEAQRPCIENKLPLHTIGSLTQKCRLQILFNAISSIFKSPKPEEAFEDLKKSLEMTISLEKSEKHMSHRDFKGIFISAA